MNRYFQAIDVEKQKTIKDQEYDEEENDNWNKEGAFGESDINLFGT